MLVDVSVANNTIFTHVTNVTHMLNVRNEQYAFSEVQEMSL